MRSFAAVLWEKRRSRSSGTPPRAHRISSTGSRRHEGTRGTPALPGGRAGPRSALTKRSAMLPAVQTVQTGISGVYFGPKAGPFGPPAFQVAFLLFQIWGDGGSGCNHIRDPCAQTRPLARFFLARSRGRSREGASAASMEAPTQPSAGLPSDGQEPGIRGGTGHGARQDLPQATSGLTLLQVRQMYSVCQWAALKGGGGSSDQRQPCL